MRHHKQTEVKNTEKQKNKAQYVLRPFGFYNFFIAGTIDTIPAEIKPLTILMKMAFYEKKKGFYNYYSSKQAGVNVEKRVIKLHCKKSYDVYIGEPLNKTILLIKGQILKF